LKEHKELVCKILQKLKKAGFYIKPEKYEFSITKTTFLAFIISKESLEIDIEKVNTVFN